ncbi:hypothetical protein [Burkholderia pseudomultivorans]|uniref:hypothetical protein n=1 Tax=Burkholderia pseudomultivorans TaxID=1207504 RepID=UPI00158D7EFE|nr:hypothetical protein [Burkholderia pseudomultivorans]
MPSIVTGQRTLPANPRKAPKHGPHGTMKLLADGKLTLFIHSIASDFRIDLSTFFPTGRFVRRPEFVRSVGIVEHVHCSPRIAVHTTQRFRPVYARFSTSARHTRKTGFARCRVAGPTSEQLVKRLSKDEHLDPRTGLSLA